MDAEFEAVAGDVIDDLAREIHIDNVKAGWWTNLATREPLTPESRTMECIALIHSEISEAMEGFRKNLKDDHLPSRDMLEVELADAMIRILDLAGAHGYEIGGAMADKLAYNRERLDHKIANRQKEGGKKF